MGRGALPVGALVATFSTVASAQNAALRVDEIVVWGAARDERRLLETPNAVTVIDQFEIERRQPSTYEELLGDVPGVTIEGGPRGISQEPNIRGFQDEQVVLRVDGARQNFDLAHRGRFFTDPEILKRVEVLRGGNSTLYGSGALGGVILLETKDAIDVVEPGELWGGRIKGGFNSQGTEFIGAGTLAVQHGDFDALAFYSYRPMLDDLEDGDGDPILNSEIDAMNGLAKFGYQPGDHRFELSYQRYDDEGLTPRNANAASTPTTVVDRELTYQRARADWSWRPAGSKLFNMDALAYFNAADVVEDRVADARLDETDYETFGLDIVNRSEFELGLPVRLSYGMEAYQDTQEATRNGGPRPQAPDAQARYVSAFAQGDMLLGGGVILTPGLRFDRFDVDPDGDFPELSEASSRPSWRCNGSRLTTSSSGSRARGRSARRA
jgi:hemoglobin/transferrin/lactoferrin receptor protein